MPTKQRRALNRACIAPQPEPQAAPDPATLITSAAACALAGAISGMTLWRWERDGVIPAPTVIRGRKFWNRAEFLAALTAAASSAPINAPHRRTAQAGTAAPTPGVEPAPKAARPKARRRSLSLPAPVAILAE